MVTITVRVRAQARVRVAARADAVQVAAGVVRAVLRAGRAVQVEQDGEAVGIAPLKEPVDDGEALVRPHRVVQPPPSHIGHDVPPAERHPHRVEALLRQPREVGGAHAFQPLVHPLGSQGRVLP